MVWLIAILLALLVGANAAAQAARADGALTEGSATAGAAADGTAPGAARPGAAPHQGSTPDARLPVIASFSILGDMVREVGGDDIRLSVIVGPMSDAHTFEPTPRDARALGAARVLVINGLGFESWLPRLIEAAGFQGREIVATRGIEPLRLDHGHDGVDPHAWQNLANGVVYVQNIALGLAEADPAHASAYYARADDYIRRLRKADADWRRQLDAVPKERRVLATSHDAFAYFGAAYGIRVLSVVGLSGDAEPSAQSMAKLIQQIRQQSIRALFLEHGSNARLLQQIAAETGVQPGGTLYADTLDRPGHEASTYLGMFHWNTQMVLKAFTLPPSAPTAAQEQAGAAG